MSKKRDVKVIFVGDASVGKSCIMQRFVTGEFSEDSTPTIGAAFLTKEMNVIDQNVVVNIWDTAGQEEFRNLVPMYYRGTDIAFIVFDLTKKETFEAVRWWINDVYKNISKNVMVYVCGNKADLGDKIEVTDRDISEIEREFNFVYFETSAKTGRNIENMFDYALTYFIQQFPSDFKQVTSDEEQLTKNVCC